LINALWSLLRWQAQQMEEQARQIAAQAKRIEELEERLNSNSRNCEVP
jgi:hypothetical protein